VWEHLACRPAGGGWAGHRWARACRLDRVPFRHPRRALAAHSSSTTCQTAPGAGGTGPDDRPLPLPLLSLPCPVLLTSLRVRAPWLPYSLGSQSPREKGVTRNQHCQHFAPSLVQARAVLFPTPQPLALHTYGSHAAGWAGGCWRHALRGTPPLPHCLPEPREGSEPGPGASLGHRDCQAPHRGVATPGLPRRGPGLLRRCTGTHGSSHLVEGCLASVYKAMNSQSFAGLAQEGRCWRLENVTGA